VSEIARWASQQPGKPKPPGNPPPPIDWDKPLKWDPPLPVEEEPSGIWIPPVEHEPPPMHARV
jgi:hypothetical protein